MDSDLKGVQATVRKIFSNCSARDPDANDSLFLGDSGTVLFDVESMIDIGWENQKARLKRDFSGLREFSILPDDNLTANIRGDFAWATCT